VDPLYLLIEAAAVAFFAVAAVAALRRGRLPFLELVSAALFGLILEQANQLLYETYEYAPEFVLTIDRAPIIIGLTWALIIAGAMRITDALGVRRRYAPFVDSVLAIMLDLAFDAIAIRMGLWTWRDTGLTDGWYGVPAGNFYAWLFVTLGFTLVTRWLRELAARRPMLEWLQLAVPIPAFAILSASIVSFALIVPLVDDVPGGGLNVFLVALVAFVAISGWGVFGPDRITPDGAAAAMLDLRLAFAVRVAIHLFFLGALLAMGLATQEPVLLGVALVMLALEAPLGWLVAMRRHSLRRSALRRQALPYPE
jgi:hypothetical protein